MTLLLLITEIGSLNVALKFIKFKLEKIEIEIRGRSDCEKIPQSSSPLSTSLSYIP